MTGRPLRPEEMAAPGSAEHRQMITASKVPVILGLSKFSSPYSLWSEMAGLWTPPPLEGDHLDWGHDIEDALVAWWRRKNPGWQTNRGEIAYTDPDLPFPNQVTLDRRARRGRRFHIVECKTDRDRSRWGYPGDEDSTPADYTSQVIFQMGVSGIHEASIVVQLGGSGAPEIHQVPWDPDLYRLIIARCTAWWESLQDPGNPPDLDDTQATYDAVRGVHPDINRGEEVVIDRQQAAAYRESQAAEASAKKTARARKTELLDLMGDAERAVTEDGEPVARRQVNSHKTVSLYMHKPNSKK